MGRSRDLFALVGLVVLAVPIVAPSRAIAQQGGAQEGEAPQGEGGTARELFLRGQTAYGQGDYEAALDQWRAAYELDPKPLIQYNISLAHERLGTLPKAVAALERYLETAEPDDPNQANARARLSSIRDRLEQTGIAIAGAPQGAEIVVDGEPWGRTPRPDPIRVEPGSHTVQLTLDGYADFRSTVMAPAGQVVEVEASMAEATEETAGTGGPSGDGGSVGAWVLVGVGGAAIAGGAVAGGLALGEAGAADDAKARDRALTLAKVGDALLWPGLAIAGAGLIWALVGGGGGDAETGSADVRVEPYVGHGGADAGARVRF